MKLSSIHKNVFKVCAKLSHLYNLVGHNARGEARLARRHRKEVIQIDKAVNILGTPYNIAIRSEKEDVRLENCDGYTDWTTKTIGIEKETNGNLGDMEVYVKKVLRHEIVHAFFLESGLHESSGSTEAWASHEAMVDWFARQGPKIYTAWQEADAL